MESENKTDTYYEEKKTVSRTNTASDPTTVKTEVTKERTLVPTSTPDIEIYEVRSGTTTASAPPPPTTKTPVAGEGQEESISEKAREAGRSEILYPRSVKERKKSLRRKRKILETNL